MFIGVTFWYVLWVCMEQQTVITVKVPQEMKKKMKQIDVNWSEYIRECVQKKIDQEKKRAAFDKLDEIRKRSKPTSTEEIVAWIREGRER
jgi:Arc/MetJ-type ribon-helix-helix transcriptional regulator